MVDLVHGPVDWVGQAAIVALTERARAHPTENASVVNLLSALFEQHPSEGAWCLEYPLVVAMLRLPGFPPDMGPQLKAWRERLESGH